MQLMSDTVVSAEEAKAKQDIQASQVTDEPTNLEDWIPVFAPVAAGGWISGPVKLFVIIVG